MKELLLILLVIPVISYSQIKLDTLNKTVSYSNIYEINKSKNQLHQKAMEWIAINFKDANEVVKLNTDDKIIAKGNFSIDITSGDYSFTYPIKFIMEISFKENKYKLDMHTFDLSQNGFTSPIKNYYFSNDFNDYIEILKEQLTQYTDKTTTKSFQKLFNNPEELNKMYQDYKTVALQIRNKVDAEVKLNAISLFEYISKKSEDSW